MKTKKTNIILLLLLGTVILLFVTSCDGDTKCTHGNVPGSCTTCYHDSHANSSTYYCDDCNAFVKFNAPTSEKGLKGQQITIKFPVNFTDAGRQEAIKGKFEGAMAYLDDEAALNVPLGIDANKLLNMGTGLEVIMEHSTGLGYCSKVVGNKFYCTIPWAEAEIAPNIGNEIRVYIIMPEGGFQLTYGRPAEETIRMANVPARDTTKIQIFTTNRS